MLRVAVLGVLLQVVLQTGIAEAICCDDIRSDIENRTNAFNVLCTNNDPHLGNCCRVIEQDLRKHKLSYKTLCPNNEVDYCKSSPCHSNATCINHSDSFSCICETGFTGSGLECTEFDYCKSSPCHSNATCISHSDSFSCKCDAGFTGSGLECTAVARSCADLYKSGVRQNGVYTIDPDELGPFQVKCDMTKDGGGWTVFQTRQNGSEDFYRGWADYKAGFGNLSGEFWLGLDKIHRLSKSGQIVLRVDLMDFRGARRFAKYRIFGVADESHGYRLNVSGYSGDAGNSLAYHNGKEFSTKDRDNDDSLFTNCATLYKSSWWHKRCGYFFHPLMGTSQTGSDGIRWNRRYSQIPKKMEMKVRPSQF